MSYENEWTWWLEEACYRVARGVSLLSNPSEVGPTQWDAIVSSRLEFENQHKVYIFRGEFITDDLGTAAEVYVARYLWVESIVKDLAIAKIPIPSHVAIMGSLFGYSPEAINDHLAQKGYA